MAKKVKKPSKAPKSNISTSKSSSKPVSKDLKAIKGLALKTVSGKAASIKTVKSKPSKSAKVDIRLKAEKPKTAKAAMVKESSKQNTKLLEKDSVKEKISSTRQVAEDTASSKDKKSLKKQSKKSGRDSEFGQMDSDFDLEEEDVQTENLKNKTQAEMDEIRALLGEAIAEESDEVEIALRDAEGRLYCKVRECDELSIVDGYCRLHYLKLWKKIQLRKKILTDGKLEKYIEELTQRYPDKYIEMLREDLKSEKSFLSAINELEIEEMNEEADMDDDQQGLIDEVRGIQPATTATDDDDGY